MQPYCVHGCVGGPQPATRVTALRKRAAMPSAIRLVGDRPGRPDHARGGRWRALNAIQTVSATSVLGRMYETESVHASVLYSTVQCTMLHTYVCNRVVGGLAETDYVVMMARQMPTGQHHDRVDLMPRL